MSCGKELNPNLNNTKASEPYITRVLLEENSLFTILPSTMRRGWIEKMALKHAYRCTPMSIASEYGWVVLNPEKFTLMWDGGTYTESIKVEPELPYVDSHFGSGVISFRFDFLFRTSPEVNIWYRGLPNFFIDGISPLEGIVETDWNPAGAVMNWRMTRVGHEVEFAKDAPLCFITPVKRGFIENFSLNSVQLKETGKFNESHQIFCQSRREFLKMRNEDKISPTAWQRFYHNGKFPDGTEAPEDHQTNIKLKSF